MTAAAFLACVCALSPDAAPPPKQYGELPAEPLELAKARGDKVAMFDLILPSICLGGMTLLTTVLLAGGVMWLIHKTGSNLSDTRSFQMLGLVIVLGLGLTALAVGWSGAQIATLSGVFGGALGYLFGQTQKPGGPQPPTTA